jgi:hypothetical protein
MVRILAVPCAAETRLLRKVQDLSIASSLRGKLRVEMGLRSFVVPLILPKEGLVGEWR